MNRINQNDFKMYAPPGVIDTLTNYCQGNSIHKSPKYTFFKLAFIVSHITTRSFYYKSNRSSCTINIETLSTILGSKNGDTTKMIRTLCDLNIICKVSPHLAGYKSSEYSIINKSPVWEEIITDSKYTSIPTKIINKRNELNVGLSNNVKMYKKALCKITLDIPSDYFATQDHTEQKKVLISSYSSTSTSVSSSIFPHHIPFTTSQSSISSNIPLMLGEYSYNTVPAKVTEDITNRFCTTKIVNPYILPLEAISKGEWFALRPDKESRVHTNLTNLKKNFRYFLRYESKPLVELDIRNSQPLIATILIKNHWLNKHMNIPVDVVTYQKDCEAGFFYDYFMEENKIRADQRGEFKKQMFGEVFFSKVTNKKSKLKNQFIKRYPKAYSAICDIKGGYGSMQYNQFAIQLQRTEAKIIFDSVNMELIREGIPAFNIFDSILCLEEHQEIAREKIMTAFSIFDITPTINYKNYGKH